MKPEEAIGRIQEHIRIHSKKEPFTPYLDEAFDMAIKALKEETICPILSDDEVKQPCIKSQCGIERTHREWIPITYRPMDEEEYEDFKKEFGELPIEGRKMFSCPMPEDDQEILICTSWGVVNKDRCVMDECGYGLEENGDWDGILAWMPLPEPYKKEGEEG